MTRWVSVDPFDSAECPAAPGAMRNSMYKYCANNPLTHLDPSGWIKIKYFPQSVVGHPWQVERMRTTAVGRTRCYLAIITRCRRQQIVFSVCRFPYVSWSTYYVPVFAQARVRTTISLDKPKIIRQGLDLRGIYGHEQQHVKNCRSEALRIVSALRPGGSFPTRAACNAWASGQVIAAIGVFNQWFSIERAHRHDESPHGDYLPEGGVMPKPTSRS